jgi:hypothetical protein
LVTIWLCRNQIVTKFPEQASRQLCEVRSDRGCDMAGSLDDILIGDGENAPSGQHEVRCSLGTDLPLTPRGVRGVAVELGHEPSGIPEQVDASDTSSCLAEFHLASGHRKSSLGDDPQALLLEPGISMRATLRAIEQVGYLRNAGAAVPPQFVEPPSEERSPDLASAHRMIERGLELPRRQPGCDVTQRAGRTGSLDQPSCLDICAAERGRAMDDHPGERPTLPLTQHGQLYRAADRPLEAVEAPEGRGRHV